MTNAHPITSAGIKNSKPIARAADLMLLFMLADQADMVQFFKCDDRVVPVATRKRKSWQMTDFEFCLADRWMNHYVAMGNLHSASDSGLFTVSINDRLAYFRFELCDSGTSNLATLVLIQSDVRRSDCEQILTTYESRPLPSGLSNIDRLDR
jgi:hypothetical protein